MKRVVCLLAFLAVMAGTAMAQQSANFKLEEHTFNAGGHPDGSVPASPNAQLTLGSVGQGATFQILSSASFAMEIGFSGSFPPPGEVSNLRFIDATTVMWDAERSVGSYNLYLGTVLNPFDPFYGTCQTSGIMTETTTVSAVPMSPGDALFILVTAQNRINEEGTKGTNDTGSERDNSNPCP